MAYITRRKLNANVKRKAANFQAAKKDDEIYYRYLQNNTESPIYPCRIDIGWLETEL
jgi:hypothetical protein